MTALTWTNSLALDHPQMDATHEEFVALLAATDAALTGPKPELLRCFEALCDHTIEHFAQEERWMEATGFAADNCHAGQHQQVLGIMLECAQRAADPQAPDFEPLEAAVGELASWFPRHAQMMDAGLAEHLVAVGFDVATGQCREAVAADGEALTHCASAHCG